MKQRNQIVIPQLLESIINWEKEVADEVPYLETPTGYFLSFDINHNGGYACSPADSIVFANTGMDGIHFSLLTDFGAHNNLDEAPVICVSPMDFDHQVRIVAANIHDFFSLSLLGCKDLLLNEFPTKEAYQQHLLEQEQQQSSEYFDLDKWRLQQAIAGERARKKFQLRNIENPYDYIAKLRAERAAKLLLPTKNGLGITSEAARLPANQLVLPADLTSHPWASGEIPEDKFDVVRNFIEGAQLPNLLAFVRDYQHQFISNDNLLRLLCDKLEHNGLQLEASRLLHCMPSFAPAQPLQQNVSQHIVWWNE